MDDDIKTKAYIAVAIFFVGFVSAVAPLKVIKIDEHIFSAGNLMASGVLLSAGLVHQLPDSMELLESTPLSEYFPVAPFITGLTFCFFLIMEEYLHTRFALHPLVETEGSVSSSKSGDSHDHNHYHAHVDDDSKPSSHHAYDEKKHDDVGEKRPLLSKRKEHPNNHTRTVSNGSLTMPSCLYDMDFGNEGALLESFRNKTFGHEHQHHHDIDHLAEHIHGSLLASVILLCALSIHSLLEGLAIAISSSRKEILSITTAVLAHKGFAGYALGSSMVASEMNDFHFWVLVTVFSICGVVGIVLGAIFEELVAVEDPDAPQSSIVGVVKAMVAGTFLYISIVEIGLKEILIFRESKVLGTNVTRKEIQWSKLIAFLFGYLAFSFLAAFI